MRTPRTLTARLVATVVVLVALVSGLVVLTTAVAMHDYLMGQKDDQVSHALQRAGNPRGGPGGDGPGLPPDGGRFLGQEAGSILVSSAGTYMITQDGALRTLSSATRGQLLDVPADNHGHTVDTTVGAYRVMATTDDNGDKVVVGLPTHDINDTIGSLVLWSTLLALAGVLLAAIAGRELIRRQLRPLREVAATAHAVTQEQLATGDPDISQRVDEGHTDPETEVGQVGHALNTLLDHMSEALAVRYRSEQQVRQFVADASHELRTPLSTIHGYAELSRRTPDDPAALSSALTKVETETDRMSRLVEDMLLLARLDSGRPLERVEVDLTKLLLETVADSRVVDAQQGSQHRWQLRLPEAPVVVVGDEQRLHQLFTNLLGNARHHTPPGTTVTVAAEPHPDRVVVEVRDDGPGLPAGLVEHAFERFTRGDGSRTRASGGAGLGLSLVSAIAQAHGGTASVTSSPGETVFLITLPVR